MISSEKAAASSAPARHDHVAVPCRVRGHGPCRVRDRGCGHCRDDHHRPDPRDDGRGHRTSSAAGSVTATLVAFNPGRCPRRRTTPGAGL